MTEEQYRREYYAEILRAHEQQMKRHIAEMRQPYPEPTTINYSSKRWKMMARIVQRDGGAWICHYCGCPLRHEGSNEGVYPEIEHMVPKSRGGTDDYDNLVVSCHRCNQAKGTKPYEVFVGVDDLL